MMESPSNPRPNRRRDDEDTDAWLMTFADMSTLIMTFFVLMFALSSPDGNKFKKVAEALRKEGFYADVGVTADPYETLKKDLSLALGASGYDQFIAISEQKDVVEVELASSSFFTPGSAKFSPAGIPMLELVTSKVLPLAKEDIVVEIEGHTDDTPIATAQYPSNWELSAARAANVVRYLISKGFPPYKLRAVGMGSSHPKAPNRDATGNPIPANQELNRRVVMKLKHSADY
jgi:chemotaxis protein MotB